MLFSGNVHGNLIDPCVRTKIPRPTDDDTIAVAEVTAWLVWFNWDEHKLSNGLILLGSCSQLSAWSSWLKTFTVVLDSSRWGWLTLAPRSIRTSLQVSPPWAHWDCPKQCARDAARLSQKPLFRTVLFDYWWMSRFSVFGTQFDEIPSLPQLQAGGGWRAERGNTSVRSGTTIWDLPKDPVAIWEQHVTGNEAQTMSGAQYFPCTQARGGSENKPCRKELVELLVQSLHM